MIVYIVVLVSLKMGVSVLCWPEDLWFYPGHGGECGMGFRTCPWPHIDQMSNCLVCSFEVKRWYLLRECMNYQNDSPTHPHNRIWVKRPNYLRVICTVHRACVWLHDDIKPSPIPLLKYYCICYMKTIMNPWYFIFVLIMHGAYINFTSMLIGNIYPRNTYRFLSYSNATITCEVVW